MRRRFYLIALLCFIEQLLRLLCFFFFLRSVPETAVSVISGFNAVAGSIPRCAATATDGFLYDDRRRDLSMKKVNTIAGNSSVRDYDDIPIDFYVAQQTYVRDRSTTVEFRRDEHINM